MMEKEWTTAKGRTLEAFREESPELQQKWIGLASVALEAVFNHK